MRWATSGAWRGSLLSNPTFGKVELNSLAKELVFLLGTARYENDVVYAIRDMHSLGLISSIEVRDLVREWWKSGGMPGCPQAQEALLQLPCWGSYTERDLDELLARMQYLTEEPVRMVMRHPNASALIIAKSLSRTEYIEEALERVVEWLGSHDNLPENLNTVAEYVSRAESWMLLTFLKALPEEWRSRVRPEYFSELFVGGDRETRRKALEEMRAAAVRKGVYGRRVRELKNDVERVEKLKARGI